MTQASPNAIIDGLRNLPQETEWAEFKVNSFNKETIGKYVSALSNSAIFCGQKHGFLVFGIEDSSHEPVGTNVSISKKSVGNETFMHWLNKHITPALNIEHTTTEYHGKIIEFLSIDPAYQQPVRFNGVAYIRIDSSLHPLKDHPQKEQAIWQAVSRFSFEDSLAANDVSPDKILSSFSIEKLTSGLLVTSRSGSGGLGYLEQEGLIKGNIQGTYDIPNLFVMLSAVNLDQWQSFHRKGVRVVKYKGTSKLEGQIDHWGKRGYATTFESALKFVMQNIPGSEFMQHGIRRKVYTFPQIAIREFLGNAIIHQDFSIPGHGPTVEIYDDRIKLTNLGKPLVETDRFIDTPSRTRNGKFADVMRRLGICEERGSGIDRAITAIEKNNLPPPLFQAVGDTTVVTLFGPRLFADMTREERLRACYQHACLGVESGSIMKNATLRIRFGLTKNQYPQVSRVISEAIEIGLIRPLDSDQANRNASYVPTWY